MSTLSQTQTDALIHMRGAGGLVTNGKGFARPTMSALRVLGLVTYVVYEHEFRNELTGRVNRPYAWIAYLTPKGVRVAGGLMSAIDINEQDHTADAAWLRR